MPRSRTTARALAGTIAVAAVATLAACGPGVDPNADIENGKAVFSQSCAGCHALKDAGSDPSPNKPGPSLDDSFRAARQDGFKESEFEANVRRWIADAPQKPARVAPYGVEGPVGQPMARDIVVGQDAQDVSAYIARVAGTDGEESPAYAAPGSPPASGGPPPTDPPTGDPTALAADPDGGLAFTKTEIRVPPGKVSLSMDNPSAIPHNVAIRQGDEVLAEGQVVGQGEVSIAAPTVELEPGEYEYFCSVPGHAEGGMVGKLIVGDGTTSADPVIDTDAIVPPPVDGVQDVPLPENPTTPIKGTRIVGPWVSTVLRDRRISRLKPAVAARSYPVDRYVKPGYWIQINPE